jgi:type IV pilus assembly protein PilN
MDKMVAEITELKNKRQALLLRIKVIQDLQDGRIEIVSIFDDLVQAMPEGIFLTKLERRAMVVTLHGFSESNHQLSMLMRNLNRSAIYDDASLVKVQQNNQHGNQVSAFNLQVAVRTTTS